MADRSIALRNAARLEEAAAIFSGSRSILFITGAGISADSGLPTYRGVGGLYDGRTTDEGLRIEEALSAQMFRECPDITWKYLLEIGHAVAAHHCNNAHRVIAALERRTDYRVWTLTQNIDGYHTEAGSRNVIEVHGSMWRMRCEHCQATHPVSQIPRDGDLPRCRTCAFALRPDVVLFDEMLPENALQTLARQLEHDFDLVVTVGTSGQFPYILHPVLRAVRRGTATIEINPAESTPTSRLVDLHLRSGAAETLTAIADRMGLEWDVPAV